MYFIRNFSGRHDLYRTCTIASYLLKHLERLAWVNPKMPRNASAHVRIFRQQIVEKGFHPSTAERPDALAQGQ